MLFRSTTPFGTATFVAIAPVTPEQSAPMIAATPPEIKPSAADVIARFKRLDGYDVFFLTGTDEHGLKVQQKAKELGIKPKDYVDKVSKEFIELTKYLNCSNNDFIRTTDNRHIKNVHSMWKTLFDISNLCNRVYGIECKESFSELSLYGDRFVVSNASHYQFGSKYGYAAN